MSPFYTAGKVKPAGLSCACTAPYTSAAQLPAVPHLTAAGLRFAPVSGPFLVPMIKTKVTSATSLLQKHSFLVPGACGRTRTGDILPGAALYRLSYTSILGNQNCTGGAATLPLLRPGHIGKGGNVKRENASRCRWQDLHLRHKAHPDALTGRIILCLAYRQCDTETTPRRSASELHRHICGRPASQSPACRGGAQWKNYVSPLPLA